MKISELIKDLTELQNEFGDMEVVLSVTDHTDYTYNFDHPGFDVGNVYDEDVSVGMEVIEGKEVYFVCYDF